MAAPPFVPDLHVPGGRIDHTDDNMAAQLERSVYLLCTQLDTAATALVMFDRAIREGLRSVPAGPVEGLIRWFTRVLPMNS